MIHLSQVVIVEGKYDKIKLSSILDAAIIETDGFAIFRDREKLDLIRRLAKEKGVVILTDSDAAGFKIRSFLSGALPKDSVRHVYVPDIYGKERRKTAPSKEGKLGVEGIPKDEIIKSLARAGVLCEESEAPARRITKTDLYEDGLSGGQGSAEKRRAFLSRLHLPQRLSANGMLEILNAMFSFDEYKQKVGKFL